jgi:hypothetical protein
LLHRLTALLSHLPWRVGERPVTHQVTDPPEQVVEYWTDERIRGARPREQRLDPPADPD